jgi:fructose/tagatose bisphosphate aldolase
MNVVKVNIGADVIRAWMRGLKEGALLESGDDPPHQVMLQHAATKVSEVAQTKLSLMGASRHAKPLLQYLEEESADLPAITAAPLSV